MDNNMNNEFDNREENNFVVEDAFKRLSEIISALENPEITLQDSLTLYAEGAKLAAACHENLEGVEKEIQIINANL